MIEFDALLAILAAFLFVTVAPGPANIAVATISMSCGRSSGLLFGAGLGVGFAVWGVVAATGLGAVLQTSAQAMFVLKLLGGAYLLWLAASSLRSMNVPADAQQTTRKSGNWFARGLLLNLSNPKAVVAWIAALAAGFGDNNTLTQLLGVTAVCVALGFANYFGYALLFSLQGCMTVYARFKRWVDGTVALFFAATGLAVIRSAFQRAP
ncbi:MAG: LysE family translocator [Pseudomonadota bacterium]